MKFSHGACLDDPELLNQLVFQELKERGVTVKLETPKPSKKSLVPFSTPGNGTKDPPVGPGVQTRVFGRRLGDLGKLLVSLEEEGDTDVLVPKLVVSACRFIEENMGVEGIYRMSGSQSRQKAMRREVESSDSDFREMNPAPSVLDVASLLKQFLRELPVPLIPRTFHTVLANSLTVDSLLLTVLLLPPDHLSCLSFLLRHLAKVSSAAGSNKMTVSNLAIVLSPNLLPTQDPAVCMVTHQTKDRKQIDSNSLKLKIHTAILEKLIQNSSKVGYLSRELHERYQSCLSLPSYTGTSHSEDNLDDETTGSRRRRSKKKHVRRRSGSLSRVLSAMGKNIQKAIGRNSVTPGGARLEQQVGSVHSTPLPQFGGTPDFPSPRDSRASREVKRKAPGEHDMSPDTKSQKRTFESTFTPKMRTRTFSVKRFKRKKSEGKFKPPGKESMVSLAKDSPAKINTSSTVPASVMPGTPQSGRCSSRRETRQSLLGTPVLKQPSKTECKDRVVVEGREDFTHVLEDQYIEVRAQYEELKDEVGRLEAETEAELVAEKVDSHYSATLEQSEELGRDTRDTARQMARVRRRSSEANRGEGRKPRSPSQRRIGVLRRRSKEREEKLKEREEKLAQAKQGRSPQTQARQRSPNCKPALTPINLNHRPSMKSKLQRGHPNTTSVGLERPSPVLDREATPGDLRPRIKMSFKGKERPVVKSVQQGPVKATQSPLRKVTSPQVRSLSQGNSLVTLKNDISDLIEKSFGSAERDQKEPVVVTTGSLVTTSTFGSVSEGDNDVFDAPMGSDVPDAVVDLDLVDHDQEEVTRLSNQIENISFKMKSPVNEIIYANKSPPRPQTSDDTFNQSSPVTRSQLRRQSHSFEFTRPALVEDAIGGGIPDNLRRQSSAFEFRSSFVSDPPQPIYENLSRGYANRGSLRRRNSSVKDLVQRLEIEARSRVVEGRSVPDLVSNKPAGNNVAAAPPSLPPVQVSSRAPRARPSSDTSSSRSSVKINTAPLRISEEDSSSLEGWVDASEFFKNVTEVPAQCGRSSIVKIRQEIRGRVQDSVTKFGGAGQTPHRVNVPASRRHSARMGTGIMTPGVARLGVVTGPGGSVHHPPTVTPTSATSARRSTLTGIRTSARSGVGGYANPTIASSIKTTEKSPVFYENHKPREPPRTRKSPRLEVVAIQKSKKSPSNVVQKPRKSPQMESQQHHHHQGPVYKNVRVDRKPSNSRDIKARDLKVERSTSGSSKERKMKVKRNRSSTDRKSGHGGGGGPSRRKETERRYLTIGYSGELPRSPLKERQNIPANVRRSNSDQTPSRGVVGNEKAMTRARLRMEDELQSVSLVTNVSRKHSLKSDLLMSSPKVASIVEVDLSTGGLPGTPLGRVKRAQSERASPRSSRLASSQAHCAKLARAGQITTARPWTVESPRRSPRFIID